MAVLAIEIKIKDPLKMCNFFPCEGSRSLSMSVGKRGPLTPYVMSRH